jgi:hypothetical protein
MDCALILRSRIPTCNVVWFLLPCNPAALVGSGETESLSVFSVLLFS